MMTEEMMEQATLMLEAADAMIEAADGFADDELVWFGGHQWSACRLREDADELIDAALGIA